jgi:hypothetical protein
MDTFALLPAPERAVVFRESAARLQVGSAIIVEKDFWVCWALHRIFLSTKLPGPLFKGGTSLSKVYKVIERFSEDVDIVLDRHALGFVGGEDPSNIAGTNKRNRKLDELAGRCSETVQGAVRHELQESFRSVLGEADWEISEDPADADRQSLLFSYPLCLEDNLYGLGSYIRPVVRLEFGSEGTYGRRSGSRFSLILRTHFPVSSLSQERKFRFYDRNEHSGRRQRCSMQSSTRERCLPAFRVIIATSPACTGTNTVRMR